MNKMLLTATLVLLLSFCAGTLFASDMYLGDSGIYQGNPDNGPTPNVLFIIDNSNSAANNASSQPYITDTADPLWVDYALTTTGTVHGKYDIYQLGQQGEPGNSPVVTNGNDATMANLNCNANSNIIRTTLLAYGSYVANATADYPSIKNGNCNDKKAYSYVTGDYLNYLNTPSGGTDTQSRVIYNAINTVLQGARYAFNFGAMVYKDSGNKGGKVIYEVGSLEDDADYNAFMAKIPGSGAVGEEGLLTSQTARPQAEALLDAGYYFRGEDLPVGGQSAMTSPITLDCDKSVIVLITNGLSNKDDDGELANIVGDLDGDGAEANPYGLGTHYLDDVAKYLHDTDASNLDGIQRINTHTILAFQAHDDLLERTADVDHGDGTYTVATNEASISKALNDIFVALLAEVDTAFVAPVVPTSPENRTYSGQRVYLGFFYPKNDEPWHGNLKKFGISNGGEIMSRSIGGNDPVSAVVESGTYKGLFKDATLDDPTSTITASSYWSTADAGQVAKGGVGQKLLDRAFTSDTGSGHRNIYTYLTPTNSSVVTADGDLTLNQNAFSTANASITFDTTLGLSAAADKDKLISFVHGLDSYDDNADGDTTDLRPWIMGDILHSKPLVVNYSSYTFSEANEANCNVNKATVYVGANDGMMHAFRDCDGAERWAFIPPDVLPNLQEMRSDGHPYYVDGTPTVYKYDADRDGNIETLQGDKVVLLFGLRRGGNAYYALDVSDPDAPEYLWQADSSTGFPQMGQSWSTPNLGKVKVGTDTMMVAFVGAGYDNLNEDGRFGDTQGFTNADVVTTINSSGETTSQHVVTPGRDGTTPVTNHPVGRGVYAIKIATLNSSGVPTIAPSASNVWDFVYGDVSNASNSARLTYSFPTDITVMDTDYDGYVDRLYAGDTGGQMWRFSAHGAGGTGLLPYSNPQVSTWYGKRIFIANGTGNGSSGTNGRKIFYRPSVTQEIGGVINLYFGTGDRAHPLNEDVIDRMYGVFDRGQDTTAEIDEDNLVDVTDNELQVATTLATDISSILNDLESTSKYGWFIELNETGHEGEKVLAPALAFNKVAYYTTYAPSGSVNANPCEPGDLGLSRLYAVDYLTGEAALNFDNANNNPSGHNDNSLVATDTRADDGKGHVLRRSDRSIELGTGIPSGIVVLMPPSGDATLLIGCGGGLCTEDPAPGGTIYPIYWRPY